VPLTGHHGGHSCEILEIKPLNSAKRISLKERYDVTDQMRKIPDYILGLVWA